MQAHQASCKALFDIGWNKASYMFSYDVVVAENEPRADHFPTMSHSVIHQCQLALRAPWHTKHKQSLP